MPTIVKVGPGLWEYEDQNDTLGDRALTPVNRTNRRMEEMPSAEFNFGRQINRTRRRPMAQDRSPPVRAQPKPVQTTEAAPYDPPEFMGGGDDRSRLPPEEQGPSPKQMQAMRQAVQNRLRALGLDGGRASMGARLYMDIVRNYNQLVSLFR